MALAQAVVLFLVAHCVACMLVPLDPPGIAKDNPQDKYPDPIIRTIPGLNVSECSVQYMKCLDSYSFINPRRIERGNAESFCIQKLHVDVCMAPHLTLHAMSMECGILAKGLVDSDTVEDDEEGIKLLALAYQIYYYFCHRNHVYYKLHMSPCFEEKYVHCISKFNEELCLRECSAHVGGPHGNRPSSSKAPLYSARIVPIKHCNLSFAIKVLACWVIRFVLVTNLLGGE
ncbi:hypothetical protein M514_05947, partial [Trichuris suis]